MACGFLFCIFLGLLSQPAIPRVRLPCMQVLRDAMLFETAEHARAFQGHCQQRRIPLRQIVISVDGRFGYNLSGAGAEDAGATAAAYR